MVSMLRRDDDEENNHKRLSTIDEGNEAVELAKLAEEEAEVAKLEEEIETVKTQLAEVDVAIEDLCESGGESFKDLPKSIKFRHKTADGYLAFLEKERSELRANMDALNNRIGGAVHNKAAQIGQ